MNTLFLRTTKAPKWLKKAVLGPFLVFFLFFPKRVALGLLIYSEKRGKKWPKKPFFRVFFAVGLISEIHNNFRATYPTYQGRKTKKKLTVNKSLFFHFFYY